MANCASARVALASAAAAVALPAKPPAYMRVIRFLSADSRRRRELELNAVRLWPGSSGALMADMAHAR